MSIKFKEDKLPENHEDRFKYLYRLQEKLRLFHNIKGKQTKTGEITIEQFRKFQHGWFKKRNVLICKEINKCLTELTEEEKEKLLELDEVTKSYGKPKDKEKYKKDDTVKTNIEDIEEV